MAKIINSIGDFLVLKGQQLGTSRWLEMSQEIIDSFADATFDHQWIHVDESRARKESPYGTTIAHGYLTLSLIPYFLDDILVVNNLNQLVNYGIKDMIYKNVVKVGSRIRMSATLEKVKDLGDICQTTIHCCVEIEGEETPALEGNILYLYYFN